MEEPPRPQRGKTADERGSDISPAEEAVAYARSTPGKVLAAANPKFLLSLANGYPIGIKQFLWLSLVLVYPAWLFVLVLAGPAWLIRKIFYGILWVLFAPFRIWMKKTKPEEYAASQREK